MKRNYRSLMICLCAAVLFAANSTAAAAAEVNTAPGGFAREGTAAPSDPNDTASADSGIADADDRYSIGADGRMQTGWVRIDGDRYYFDADGKMATGRVRIGDDRYYFDTDGRMKTGWVRIDGDRYYFDADGKMVTGRVRIDGSRYYFGRGGKMKTGWVRINKSRYYFKDNGKMVTGQRKINGSWYYFADNGRQKTGWVTRNGEKYYYQPDGGMLQGVRETIGDQLCTFDDSGVLIRSIDKTKPMVALTYDDGPSVSTDKILRVLEENGGLATFFVVGERVPLYASAVKRASDMGCEIGNHTYNHTTLTRLSAAGIRSQLQKTSQAVKKITGSSPTVMRPPGGSCNSTVRSAAGMPVILWSIDTLDWKTRSAPSTISAVLNHVKDGDIVLMHDLHAPTADASVTIIPSLVKKGYQLVTVSELAECRGGIEKGKVYTCLRP